MSEEQTDIDECLTDEIRLTTETITRVEIIDEIGKRYSRWNCKIEPRIQDNGRTLKIFVGD